MPITPSCFIDSAERLLTAENISEPDYRTIVSRAYYGAFHAARNFAYDSLDIDLDNIKGGTHIVLSESIVQFRCTDKEREREIKRVGCRLHIFHTLRIRSDYNLDDTLTEKDAKGLIRNSRELLSQIELIALALAA